MNKNVIGIAVGIIIIGGVIYYLLASQGGKPVSPPPASSPQAATQPATSTYTGSNFTVVYPSDFNVDPTYQYTSVSPTKPISGVKFSIPMTMATGTNLAADSYVSVEWLPHAKKCTADIYIKDNVKAVDWPDKGVVYSYASTTGAAAGNFYEEDVYALPQSSPCTAVRYYIHTTDINNYPAGTVQQFDRAKLMDAFDGIRRSLTLQQGVPSATTTTQ